MKKKKPIIILTQSQQTDKDEINKARKHIVEAKNFLSLLISSCNHSVVNYHDCAQCVICEEIFGHWCSNSPDHACHYYTDFGEIVLVDGSRIAAPLEHDVEYETDDSCIYCMDPEERK